MRLAKGILAVLFILLPLSFWIFLYQGYELPKWFIFRLGLFLLVVVVIVRNRGAGAPSQSGTKIPVPFFLYPLSAFFFFSLLSLGSAVNLYQGFLSIANLILGLSLYFFITAYFDKDQIHTLLFLIVLPSLPVALYGICQMFGLEFIHLSGPFRGAISTFGHRNFVAEYLLMIIPLLLYASFFHSAKPLRIFSVLTLLPVYTHFVLTHTRGAYVSLAIVLLFLSVSLYKDLHRGTKEIREVTVSSRRLFLTLGVLFCFTVFFLFLFFRISGEQPIKVQVPSPLSSPSKLNKEQGMPGSLQSRLLIWQASLAALKAHPVTGVGIGNLPEVLAFYHSDQLKNLFRGRIEAGTSHNEFIQNFAETGILGGISFLLFVIFLLAFVFRTGYQHAGKGNYLPLFLSAGILGILVDSLVSSPFQRPVTSFFFWFFIAWIVVLKSSSIPFCKRRVPLSLRTRGKQGGLGKMVAVPFKILFPLTVFLGFSAYYFGYLPLLADFHGRRALEHYLAGNSKEAVVEIERAVRFQPQDQYLLTLAGNIYLATGQFEKAMGSYYRVIVYHPYWFQGYGNLGLSLFKAGRFVEAEDYYLYSLRMDSYQPVVHNSLGALYLRTGKGGLAREEFLKALALDPEFEFAKWNLEELEKQ